MKNLPKIVLPFILTVQFVYAFAIFVPEDYPTIQEAVNASLTGDSLIVSPGVYEENVIIAAKNITIGSLFMMTGDTSYIASSIIDGMQNGPVVMFNSFISESMQLNGFTLTNGSGIMTCNDCVIEGGAIYCTQADPTLMNLVIENNVIPDIDGIISRGSGISCNYADPVILNTVIKNNSHSGIYLSNNSSPVMNNIQILNNGAEGLVCSFHSNPSVNNAVIANNVSTGIKCVNESAPILRNVSLINHPGYGITVAASNVTVVNSIMWGNSPSEVFLVQNGTISVAYSNVENGFSAISSMNGSVDLYTGNINEDPVFVNSDDSNFTLDITSPCIDEGTAFFIHDGDTLVDMPEENYFGNNPDLGAYEFGVPPGILGDVNYDGSLNVLDIVVITFIIFGNNPTNFQLWAADMNFDAVINVIDIVLIVDEIIASS